MRARVTAMPTQRVEVAGRGRAVRVSSPDRVIYEETPTTAEVTKLQVVEYYVAVADGIMRALRDRPTALERWPERRARRHQARHPGRRARPTPSTPSGCPRGRRLRRDGRDHLPVRPHRRRDLPDRDRHGGLGARRWARSPSTRGRCAAPTSTTPTSCASTSTPSPAPTSPTPPGSRWPRGTCSPTSGSSASRRPAATGASTSTCGIEPRWDFVDVRHAAIAFGRELERRTDRGDDRVVEGGARREHLRRLQPEQPRPHHRERLLAAADPGRAGVDAGGRGTSSRGSTRGRSTCTRCRRGSPSAATRWPPSTTRPGALDTLLQMYADDIASGLTDMPYPPDYPKMPGEPPRVQPSRINPLNWREHGS